MKIIAVIYLAFALGVGMHLFHREQVGKISVTATVVDIRATPTTRTDLTLLWNRNIRKTPIGSGVLTCTKIAAGGVFQEEFSNCYAVYSFPLGKITAQGVIHSYRRYTLVITGGTGTYKGVSGSMFGRQIAERVRNLTFRL